MGTEFLGWCLLLFFPSPFLVFGGSLFFFSSFFSTLALTIRIGSL